METRLFKLSFKSPVHFGDGKLDGAKCSCDAATLFSALYIEALRMGCESELLAETRAGRMLLSDAFPFIGSDYYLPKPMVVFEIQDDLNGGATKRGDSRAKKAFKKIQFVRSTSYDAFLQGVLDPLAELEAFKLGVRSLRMGVNLERRSSDDAEPYGVGGFSFFDNAGLYFMVNGSYDIAPIVEQLQYSGIGGKRSSGYGRFSFDVVEDASSCISKPILSNALPESCGRLLLLSSAAPSEDELSDELLKGSSYRLERKGGFVQSSTHAQSPQKKRDFYVFASGSVFNRPFVGDVFDVNMTSGAHSVYRYARPLWMEV